MIRVFKGSFYALKSFLTGVLVLTGMLIPFFVLGQIFEDNFDSYDVGLLNNQGDWTCSQNRWYVTATTSHTLNNSVKIGAEYLGICSKIGSDVTTGGIRFWIKAENCGWGTSRKEQVELRILKNSTEKLNLNIGVDPTGKCYINPISAMGFIPLEVPLNTFDDWVEIGMLWDTTDIVKTRWYYGDYLSEWENYTGNIDFLNKIELYSTYGSGGKNWYVDTILNTPAGFCELGDCKYCETYDTCIDAGCFWYYSMYGCQIGLCYVCVEPFEPEPEECGEFYKCQYCLTQETCEAQFNCEWVDRGLGEKCYMLEPEIPPEQVEWKTCLEEMEDCEELGLPEKWICYLKNLILGQFCPDQTKLTQLFNTLGAFKDKFPFNYISAIQTFFKSVKDSLNQQKEIPIKIFGKEKNIDFSFWEKTGEVGGVVETFKSVVKDFVTLVLVIGFLTWLLSFIRRFW